MKCPHCGEELPEGYVFIPPEKPENEQTSASEQDVNNEGTGTEAVTKQENELITDEKQETAEPAHNELSLSADSVNEQLLAYYKQNEEKKKKLPRLAAVGAAAVAVVVIIISLVIALSHPKLKYDIAGDWTSGNDFISSTKLTVTDSTITLRESFGFMEISNASYSYSVKSDDTIEIQGRSFNVNVTNDMLIITPGLTGAQQDIWYSSGAAASADSGAEDNNADQSDGSSNGML